MDFFWPICRYLIIPIWVQGNRKTYLKQVQYLEKSQYFDIEQIKKIQWERVKNILHHAYEKSPFYHKRLRDRGVHPEDIKSWNDFLNIPLLTKKDVRNHEGKLFAPNFDKYYYFCTSGSTGIPLEGYRNKECQIFKNACELRSNLWTGYRLGERIYCLYGNPDEKLTWKIKLKRKLLTRERYLDTLDLSDQAMMDFANLLRKKPPSLLYGHVHNMYIFAQFLEKNGINDIQPKGMFSAGMVLHDWERKKVEKVFNCKFQNRYGCEEFGVIAAECKKQEGLHVNTDGLYVEFIGKDGRPVPPGEFGQIVVTDLTNYVMPFIRYKMGDIGILSANQCSCGRTQPLIEEIEGRIADFLLTPDGKAISGISLTDHFGASIPGVAQIQIIQEKIDLLVLKIVKDTNFNNSSKEIMDKQVRKFFGAKMRYECNFVEKIPQEPSGKYRFTICKIDNPFMEN